MRIALIITVFLLFLGPVAGQEVTPIQGMILGIVTDLSGDPLPGANVVLKGAILSDPRGMTTDLDGRYRFENLPDGTYQVAVSYIGYKTSIGEEISVAEGQAIELNVVLRSGAIFQGQMVVSASRRREKALDAPASVSIVEAAEIRNQPNLTVAEHLKNVPAVDMAQTGLAQANAVVRGFNNVFSGALLTLVDNRIARVPSLRVNAHNFIPLTQDDIERIEVVLGPGSALYGPNSANGVMHIITRSPFGSEGTSIGILGGERSLRNVSFRHAGSSEGKFGFKLSGQYYSGTDWKYVDPEEVRLRGTNPRDYDLERMTGELRLDIRPQEDLSAIFSAGFTRANNLEMTGLGAAQGIDWGYLYLQSRLRYKDWFAQVFYNRSDAGETRLLTTNDAIVDKSTLTVFQLQHALELTKRQRFTYGADVLRTRPDTESTINGTNEDKDDINEYGFYIQSETALSDHLDIVLAARVDDHNHIVDMVFSPRAAIVIKPNALNTLRFTYNRAFGTPSSNSLFLDIRRAQDPFKIGTGFQPALGYSPNIDIRVQGGMKGFTFNRDGDGLPTYRSPFSAVAGLAADQQIPLHDPQFTNVTWGIARGAVLNNFVPSLTQLATGLITQQMMAAGMPADQAQVAAAEQAGVLATAFVGIVPQVLPGLRNTLGSLNTKTFSFDPVSSLENSVTDIAKIKPTITETFEIGYKAVIQEKFLFAADAYWTRTTDFVGPLRVETPNVFLEADALSSSLSTAFAQALQNPAVAQLAGALSILDSPTQGGNANGSSVDELTRLFVAGTDNNGAAFIPFGTVTPEEITDPHAVMLAYRNFGKVNVSGLDLSFVFYPNPTWTFTGGYSHINKNLFKNLDSIGDI
ncbi:MAG TPA: hypothetical protein DIU35_07115, partial [Candidatus Latescibacteria bacterium]|nr:hypothetical protein [Candidatus Latescibacterota bacterium]